MVYPGSSPSCTPLQLYRKSQWLVEVSHIKRCPKNYLKKICGKEPTAAKLESSQRAELNPWTRDPQPINMEPKLSTPPPPSKVKV